MNAPQRGALMFVRFTAAGVIGVAILEIGLVLADDFAHRRPVEVVPCLGWSVIFVLGVAALARSRAIAGWVSDKLDE